MEVIFSFSAAARIAAVAISTFYIISYHPSLGDGTEFSYDRNDLESGSSDDKTDNRVFVNARPDYKLFSLLLTGPLAWAKKFPEACAGQSNSPIDLNTGGEVRQTAKGWSLGTGWITDQSFKVKDEIVTFKWTLNTGGVVSTSGGGLPTSYRLAQFHLHWGTDNTKGSEHTINNKRFPLEIHFVHWSSKFADINAAVASGDSDALAVLGFFFQIQGQDNPLLAPLTQSIMGARASPTDEIGDFVINNLQKMIGEAIGGDYYRYFGGLTTPACNEIVLWTVFHKPIPISKRQMDIIRGGDGVKPQGGDYFREPVALNGRTVIRFEAGRVGGGGGGGGGPIYRQRPSRRGRRPRFPKFRRPGRRYPNRRRGNKQRNRMSQRLG